MRRTGLSVIIGSWKIIAMRLPRSARMSRSESFARSLPLIQDAAAGDTARRVDEAHDREAGDGLAGAGLADQPQDLAARDGERHVVHRLHHAGAGEEMRAQVAHLERCGAHRFSRGLSTSRNWSPTRLIATMVSSSAMPG